MTTWASGYSVPNPQGAWDGSIIANLTKVRRVHLIELREFLEDLDGHYHVFGSENGSARIPSDAYANWSDASVDVKAGETKIRAGHFLEIRNALGILDGHYHTAHGLNSTPKDIDTSWTSGTIAAEEKIRADHISELRTVCSSLVDHTHIVCCECESTCSCECTCTCECTCNGEI